MLPARRRRSGVRRRGPAPGFEPLEGRVVLDAAGATARGLGVLVSLEGGTLTVEGSDGPDRIEVGQTRAGVVRVAVNGRRAAYPGVGRVEVRGNGGADSIRVAPRFRVPIAVDGGAGPDRIVAVGSSADVSGGGGNDVLVGGGGGRPTLDGDTGAGRVVLAGPLGTIRVAAGAGGEALDLLGRGYRLAPLRAGAASAARADAGFGDAPVVVGPDDLAVPTKAAAVRAAYAAGGTVAITGASAAQAQQFATLVGHANAVGLRDGRPVAAMVALRKVSRGGGLFQYETSVMYPSEAAAGPRARAAGDRQLEALTAVFAASPTVASPAATSDPGNLLNLTNSYLYRGSVTGPTSDFIQNTTTVFGVRSFQNRADFYYVAQETDLVAASVNGNTNEANIYMTFQQAPQPPGLIEATPQTTLATTSVTSGVSYNIGGSIGFNQSQGFNASVSGGVTLSNTTTTAYPPIDIRNLSNNTAFGRGNPAWSFAVNLASAPGTAGTTITAVDSFIWVVPFGLYAQGQQQLPYFVQVDYDTSPGGATGANLPVDPSVPIPFGNVEELQPPVVASVNRPSVTPGQVFTIGGSGFYPSLVSNVLVGGVAATFQAVSDTAITVVASGQPGAGLPVVVLTRQGVSNDNVTVDIAPPPAPPTTIVGNLGQPVTNVSTASNLLLGGRFTVDAGAIWSVDSATLLLDPGGSPLDAAVSLYADDPANDRPGAKIADLGTLSAPAYSGYLPQTVTRAPGAPTVPLFGGTSYWLVVDAGPNGLNWANTTNVSPGPDGVIDPLGVAFYPSGAVNSTIIIPQQFSVRGRRIGGT